MLYACLTGVTRVQLLGHGLVECWLRATLPSFTYMHLLMMVVENHLSVPHPGSQTAEQPKSTPAHGDTDLNL